MWRRFLHLTSTAYNVQKSPLAVLRVKTGYSFSNCKKALELHHNDLQKAEEWLHEQAKADGWGKVSLQSRVTQHGLIGIATTRNLAAMVEVNCETDFVARNGKFQDLVTLVTESTLEHYIHEHNLENGFSKSVISKEDLENMKCSKSSMGTITDLIASGITLTGEKLAVRRGICYHFNEEKTLLSAYCHPLTTTRNIMLGKYGAFVFYRQNEALPPSADISIEEIGKRLCLQVIGRNPKIVGDRNEIIKEETERALKMEKQEEQQQKIKDAKEAATEQQEQDQKEVEKDSDSEVEESNRDSQFTAAELEQRNKIFLLQECMHDSDYYVWEYLEENRLEVLNFSRFQCGEVLE